MSDSGGLMTWTWSNRPLVSTVPGGSSRITPSPATWTPDSTSQRRGGIADVTQAYDHGVRPWVDGTHLDAAQRCSRSRERLLQAATGERGAEVQVERVGRERRPLAFGAGQRQGRCKNRDYTQSHQSTAHHPKSPRHHRQ